MSPASASQSTLPDAAEASLPCGRFVHLWPFSIEWNGRSLDSTLPNERDPLANDGFKCCLLLPYRRHVRELHRGTVLREPFQKTCRIVDGESVGTDVTDLRAKVKNQLDAVAST